jgi:hypothetical protein
MEHLVIGILLSRSTPGQLNDLGDDLFRREALQVDGG